MDGVNKSVRNPIAFYHLALMEYSPQLGIETILLFEKMVVFYRANRFKPFEYQQERLMNELHIKRTRLEKARAFLMSKGILVELNPGKGKKIRYTLNKDKVIASIPSLYKLPDDIVAKKEAVIELKTFFEYFLSREYLGKKKAPTVSDEVYTGKYSIMGPDKRQENTDKPNNEEGSSQAHEEN